MIDEERLASQVVGLLEQFHQRRLAKLDEIKLKKLLDKNPYLYRSTGVGLASDFVRAVLDAFVSSSDETMFGQMFFEPLAKWAATEASRNLPGVTVQSGGGAGFDIAIESDTEYRAVAVKSGTSIFNAQSGRQQNAELDALQARIREKRKVFYPIIGHGYGRQRQRDPQPKVLRLAGQSFWAELTGEDDFYLRISRSLGDRPAALARDFDQAYDRARNRLEKAFFEEYVAADGMIDWDRVIVANSGREPPRKRQRASKPTTTK